MEFTLLNTVFVFSFFFVSVSLGIKWLGETIIQIILARQGLEMIKHQNFVKIRQEDEDEW